MEYQRATKSTQKGQSETPSSPLCQTSLNHIAVHPLLELQRTIGNQAVLNLLRSQNTYMDASTQVFRESRFSHDFSRIPIHSTQPAALQTKLTVNQLGDAYEREADQVAEQVMRMTDPQPPVSENEGEVKNSLMHKQSTGLGASAAIESPDVPPIVHTVLSSGVGQPLDAATRAFMEPRFGHDFSRVRVHTDERAVESTKAVNALAYAVGRDVVFGVGQYAPGASVGQRLLAHELTHVVQQGAGQLMVQRAVALADLDYQALAEQLYKAMKGWGTDEEAIYIALQKLGKDIAAIEKLKKQYKETYKKDLEAEIRSEMSGDELRLALDLMGIKDDPKKETMVGAASPGTDDEYKTAAKKLYAAMKGWGTDEEAIYAVLIPFKRDNTALQKLKNTYQNELSGGLTGKGLEEDIKDEMSSDELAYALYLLNAPPPATLKMGAIAIPNVGTEASTGKVGGGEASVHTGTTLTKAGGTVLTEGFSIGYKGGLASESNWLQFIWREIIVTHPTKGEYCLPDPISTSGGYYNLTTDPDKPNYNVDSANATNPFYEASFVANRTAEATTIYDRPSPIQMLVNAQFDNGATKVISRAHFNTYLIRDYKTLYHVSLEVEWVFTNRSVPPRTQTVRSAGEVNALPEEMKERLIARYPKFAYIQ